MDPTDIPPPQEPREPNEQDPAPELTTPLGESPRVEYTSPTGSSSSSTDVPITPLEAPKPRGKIVVLSIAIIVAVLGAATFVAVRSGTKDSKLDTLVPSDAIAYVEIHVRPSGAQADALRSLLGRLPQARRDLLTDRFDDQLSIAFKESGLDYKTDVEPWIGDNFALAFRSPAEGSTRGPIVVGLVEVKDEAAARAAFKKAKPTEDSEYVVEDGIAYLADEMIDITSLRSAVTAKGALAADADYTKEVATLGDSIAMAWFDGGALQSSLGGFLGQGLIPGMPFGTSTQTPGAGFAAIALRASKEGFELYGHSTASGGMTIKAGKLALLEAAPANITAALSLYNPAQIIDGIEQAMSLFAGGFGSTVSMRTIQEAPTPGSLFGNADPFKQLGLDLDKDIKPWLQGEMSVIVGSVTTPPIPDVAVLIDPTDDAAAKRALDRIAANLGGLGLSVQTTTTGFNVNTGFVTVAVVREADRIIIASSPAYAASLMTASPAALADDAVYRRSVGTSSDGTAFQLYVRLDRIQSLVEAFLPADDRASYEKDAKPFLDELEALAMRVTVNGTEGTFSLKLTVRE